MKIMTTIRKSVSGQNSPNSATIMDTEDARKALERQEKEQQVEQARSMVKAEAANQAHSKEMLNVKYCGGAKISSTKAGQDIVLPSYEGLRLYNPENNCYIHAALNSIVTNPDIMEEMSYAFQLPGMPPFFGKLKTWLCAKKSF